MVLDHKIDVWVGNMDIHQLIDNTQRDCELFYDDNDDDNIYGCDWSKCSKCKTWAHSGCIKSNIDGYIDVL